MLKRITAIFLLLTLCLGLLNGCRSSNEEENALTDQFVEDQDQNGSQNDADNTQQSGDQGTAQELPSTQQNQQQNTTQDNNNTQKEEQQNQPSKEEQTTSNEQEPSKEEATDSGNQDNQEETVTPSPEEALSNLYQSSTLNTAIGYDGKNTKNSNFTVSKPIEVKAGDSVTFGPVASAQVVAGYAYDSAGKPLEIINAHTAKETVVFSEGMRLYTYSVPSGAVSVKFSVHNSNKNEFVVARNNEFDLTEYTDLSGTLATFVADPLKDKDGLFVGDSICIATRDELMSGVKGWPRRIADQYGMNVVNNGKSGVSVSNKRSQGTVLTQLLEKKTQDFDYVVLQGGVNDAWSLVDVGVMEDSFDPTEFDPTTFAGGLELLIYNAILYYGDTASIGYLMTFNTPSFTKGRIPEMPEYYDMAKKICEKWGITYFDMYNHEQITKELKMNTLTNTTDYLHPSSSGYDIISPYIAEYMMTMTPVKQEVLETVLAK